MRAFSRITLLSVAIVLLAVTGLMAQREISGTVYMDGKPAAGITVEAHRGGTAFTGFDGKYKVEADSKTKWIKFTAADGTEKKIDLDENSGDNIDCALTGEIPSGNEEDGGVEVNVQTEDELLKSNDKMDYMTAVSLYTEPYKQGDLETAYSYWEKVYKKYPASHLNLYIRGAKILEYLIEHAKTDEERDKYLDELMKMYDKRIKYFGEKGFVLGRKATSLLKYKLEETRKNPLEGQQLTDLYKKAYEWLNESVTEQGAEAETPTLLLLMQTSVALFKSNELPKETVVNNYDRCTKILNQIISENKDPDRVTNAKKIQPFVEDVFGDSGAADCDALVKLLTPQFEENKDNAEFIKSMLHRLLMAKCDNSELVDKATIRLYDLEPSAEAAFNLAHNYYFKDDIENAKKYYLQAIDQEKDPKLRASYYYEYGALIYGKDKDYPKAREIERKAISLDPTLCKAYMLIGDIYVAAASSFSDDNFTKATVYWLAVDYYNKARAYENCAVDAANRAADYKTQFPSVEDGFMQKPPVKEGDTYKVGGWINETTTARLIKK